MKPAFRRITALLILICILLPLTVHAITVTEDGHVINNPSLLEQFVFPDNWSAEPLRFCVGNGILKGRGNDLAAGENITRAETAAMLVRLLGVSSEAPDLSAYTDARIGAWYYPELAAAVEQGILLGTSETTLSPDDAITRQQAFTLLSRAFGLYAADGESYKAFTDWEAVSGYAAGPVSALKERGIVSGYPDGTLRPRASITRAEFAQLLYTLFTCVCDDAALLPESGRVLYRGSEPLPGGLWLDGSLTLAGNAGEVTVTGLTLSGELTLRGRSDLTLEACAVSKVNVCVPGTVLTLNSDVETCVVNAENVTVQGTGTADTMLINGKNCKVEIACGDLTDTTKPDALKIVETLVVWDNVTTDTYLYSSSNLTGRIIELPAGTKLDHYYYREGNRAASVYTEEGRFGWVDINCIAIPETYDIREAYSQEIMEDFVNRKGYTSSTRYMIWVSLKTQTVNVFEGKKGEWKLIRSMPCASGKNSTPTARGEFSIQKKLGEWDFGSYKVKNVTVFYGGYAFHSRIYNRSYTQLLDDAIGYPASDGCLRMLDEDCRYIVDNMPYGTRVVVY